MEFPTISIVIPTLNSEKTIGLCLGSILDQDYPGDKIEIIIADGGSGDSTITIINSAGCRNLKIIPNELKTGEAGKAAGVKAAKGDIIAFIDSDNILPARDWLKKMAGSFSDPEIIASEPIEYTYRRQDGYITRYCALMGMNDPLCFFLGNYDRQNLISGAWTAMPHTEEDKGGYLKIGLDRKHLPTIGANGFLIRRYILNIYGIGDYLFDIDILQGFFDSQAVLKIAKVKIGIVHIFAGGFKDFCRKQKRRIQDYAFYKEAGLRRYEWGAFNVAGIVKFIICASMVFPLLFQAVYGYVKKRDTAWFFHAPACVATLWIYAFSSIRSLFYIRAASREKWQAA
jgi:glycosyltransferase involved in cell wall biosynthesis